MARTTGGSRHAKTCRGCGALFTPTVRHASFCSDACRAAYQAEQAVNRYAPVALTVRTCPYCGEDFLSGGTTKRFCNSRCTQQYHYQRRKRETTVKPWVRLRFSILARDGFRCRYCGRSAQEDAVRLEVDHIVPRSQGGDDSPSNLITSCQECNYGKADILLLAKHGQIPSYLTIETLTVLPGRDFIMRKSRPLGKYLSPTPNHAVKPSKNVCGT